MNQHASPLSPQAQATEPIAYWNAALSYSGKPLELSNGYKFQFEGCDAPDGNTLAFQIHTAGKTSAVVVLDDFPFADVFGVSLSLDTLADLQTDLRDDLLRGTIEHLRQSISEVLEGVTAKLPLRPIRECVSESCELNWLSIAYAQPEKGAVRLRIGLNPFQLGIFIKAIPLAAQSVWQSLRQELKVSVSVQIGVENLPLNQIKALEAGDLILLSTKRLGQRMWVEGPHSVHLLILTEKGWGCEKIITKEVASAMNAESAQTTEALEEQEQPPKQVEVTEQGEQAVSPEVAMPSFAELPVSVSFEIDEREMSVAELESWTAGSLVSIEIPALNKEVPIFVRAGGKRIAQGNLVQIDSRIALRVSNILG